VWGELRESYYSTHNVKKQRKRGQELWPAVEAFASRAPADSASRASLLAVMGWLRCLAGFEDEALELFRESREADPDVAYGYLFEGMVWLSRYLTSQRLPGGRIRGTSVFIEAALPESDEMKTYRTRFESILAEMRNRRRPRYSKGPSRISTRSCALPPRGATHCITGGWRA